jgi:hypothetical protein
MSVSFLRDAVAAFETDKLIRFARLHLSEGKEETGRMEIDKSRVEAVPVDESALAHILSADESTVAPLYFHLHFYLIRKSGERIHDGSR